MRHASQGIANENGDHLRSKHLHRGRYSHDRNGLPKNQKSTCPEGILAFSFGCDPVFNISGKPCFDNVDASSKGQKIRPDKSMTTFQLDKPIPREKWGLVNAKFPAPPRYDSIGRRLTRTREPESIKRQKRLQWQRDCMGRLRMKRKQNAA